MAVDRRRFSSTPLQNPAKIARRTVKSGFSDTIAEVDLSPTLANGAQTANNGPDRNSPKMQDGGFLWPFRPLNFPGQQRRYSGWSGSFPTSFQLTDIGEPKSICIH
jgi:hypothetical protein